MKLVIMVIWKVGHKYKIKLKDGSIYTALILECTDNLISFQDKHNLNRVVSHTEVATSKEINGDNGENYSKRD